MYRTICNNPKQIIYWTPSLSGLLPSISCNFFLTSVESRINLFSGLISMLAKSKMVIYNLVVSCKYLVTLDGNMLQINVENLEIYLSVDSTLYSLSICFNIIQIGEQQ